MHVSFLAFGIAMDLLTSQLG